MSTCWICGGEGVLMGTIGYLEWYRCRNCWEARWVEWGADRDFEFVEDDLPDPLLEELEPEIIPDPE